MFAKRCFSCALVVTNGRHKASAMKYDLEILFILKFSWRDGAVGRRSRTALGGRISVLFLALPGSNAQTQQQKADAQTVSSPAAKAWRKRTTPRKLQITQMKVPHEAHG